MAINKVEKCYVIVPAEKKEELLKELQRANIMHIESDLRQELELEPAEEGITTQEIELHIAQAEYVIEWMEQFEKKQTLAEKMESSAKIISYDEFQSISRYLNLPKVYQGIYNLVQKRKDLDSEIVDLEARLTRLEPYRSLEIGFSEIADTAHVRMRLGTISNSVFKDFHLALSDLTNAEAIHKIVENYQGLDYIVFAYHKEFLEEVEKILSRYNYRDEDLKVAHTVKEEIDLVNKRFAAIEREKNGILEEGRLMSDRLDRVRLMYDYLVSLRNRKKAENHVVETSGTAILKGWIRTKDRNKVEKYISPVTDHYEVYFEPPRKGEDVPVEIINSNFVSPLEMITGIFSTPKYSEYDPTVHLFPFFILFFAICINDAGYGVALLIGSLIGMKFMGPVKMLKVMLYAGIISIIVGLLTGEVAGIPRQDLPLFIQAHSVDLNEKAQEFLVFAIFLGIVQLAYAYIISTTLFIRHKEWLEAVERFFEGLIFSTGMPIMVFTAFLNKPLPYGLDKVFPKVALFSVIVFVSIKIILAMKELFKEKIIPKTIAMMPVVLLKSVLADSFITIVKAAIEFLRNMLSYSRLMALGMAGASIAMVVTLLASLAKGMVPIPVLDVVVYFLVLILGHLLNIALSCLSGFVHSMRLQFVEFFPYFFEGGGRKFEPFGIESRYNKISAD